MFSRIETANKNRFLEEAKAARQERASERCKETSVLKIQVHLCLVL